MTTQVAVMNAYGLAMASDRHVFRCGEERSTGLQRKLVRLRGPVPAAMMASGPFAVFNVPIARLALRLERCLAAAPAEIGPDGLAETLLRALEQPLEVQDDGGADPDGELLACTAELVVGTALDRSGEPLAGLRTVLAEMEQAPRCRGGERFEADTLEAWSARAEALPGLVRKPEVAEALREAPDLCGRAVLGALTRDWRPVSDLYLTIGLCCPRTGVPALIALKLWKGIGRRLHFASRLEREWDSAWRSGRTVLVAQGSGRPVVEALVDGVSDEHWTRLGEAARGEVRPGMNERWDRAHDRISVSSPRELGAIATGLVRGAEVVGYLTRNAEGTVAEVDGLIITPAGVEEQGLAAGAALAAA
ncbi:MAG TPA: hypothetical protein VMI52_03115 [Acetobacteraceae bacterium]|nr:hypothetical protein [Acetobacteraceae bacterium]